MIDLQRFRKEKNISQKEIIKITGLSQGYISEIERCIKPMPKETFLKLTYHYGNDITPYIIDENDKWLINKTEITNRNIAEPKTTNSMENYEDQVKNLKDQLDIYKELVKSKDQTIVAVYGMIDALKEEIALLNETIACYKYVKEKIQVNEG